MKKSAVKAGVTVLVIIAVVLWSLLNNYFRGKMTAIEEQATEPVVSTEPAIPVVQVVSKTETVSTVTVVVSAPVVTVSSVTVTAAVSAGSVGINHPNSQFCRAQYQELMRVPNGHAFRQVTSKNPSYMDRNCFAIPGLKGVDGQACFEKPAGGSVFGSKQQIANLASATVCDVFVIYYKYMLTDYLNPDVSNIKNIPDDVLRAKITAQLVLRPDYDPKLMETLAKELLRRSPDDIQALKLYLKAQYLLPGHDFSNKGVIYPIITKAYKMAPLDEEVQHFVAYSVMVSEQGLFKLTELEFLKKDFYLYYFTAWFHWKNKSGLEKVKSYLNTGIKNSVRYKYTFIETLKTVNDPKTVYGQDKIFNLNFETMPSWEVLNP